MVPRYPDSPVRPVLTPSALRSIESVATTFRRYKSNGGARGAILLTTNETNYLFGMVWAVSWRCALHALEDGCGILPVGPPVIA